jgi:hypothetical protein
MGYTNHPSQEAKTADQSKKALDLPGGYAGATGSPLGCKIAEVRQREIKIVNANIDRANMIQPRKVRWVQRAEERSFMMDLS